VLAKGSKTNGTVGIFERRIKEMKFTLGVSTGFNIKDKELYEELGFKFEYSDSSAYIDYTVVPEIELNSLEELIAFGKKVNNELVINHLFTDTPELEIYNGYRE
jgi:hypothetical protein